MLIIFAIFGMAADKIAIDLFRSFYKGLIDVGFVYSSKTYNLYQVTVFFLIYIPSF